jgi:uncharacterized protein HemX
VLVLLLAGCGSTAAIAPVKATRATVTTTTVAPTTTTTVPPTTTTVPPTATTIPPPPTTIDPVTTTAPARAITICLYGAGQLGYMRIELNTQNQDLNIATSQLQGAESDGNSEGISQATHDIASAEQEIQQLTTNIAQAVSEGCTS